MDIKKELADFISEELLDGEDAVDYDENLLADGMVDSLGMLRLVAFIEERYDYKVPPEHFTIENFRSVDAMHGYLDGKAGSG